MLRLATLLLAFVSILGAEAVAIPTMNFALSAPDTPQQLVSSLNVLVVLTLLFLAPSMVLVMTTFTRFVIVFGFFKTSSWNAASTANTASCYACNDIDIFCYGTYRATSL
jgi:flagellar biosynthesis protein FliP